MKKLLFTLLIKFFKKQIINYFIEEELPTYEINMKDRKILDSIVELTSSDAYRIFVKLQQNKKNFLGKKLLAMKYSNEREASLKHSFIAGEAYNISHTLQMLKYIKINHQLKERSSKVNKGK